MKLTTVVSLALVCFASVTDCRSFKNGTEVIDLVSIEKHTYRNVQNLFMDRTLDFSGFLTPAIKELIPYVKQIFSGKKTAKLPKLKADALCSACLGGANSLLAIFDSGLVGEDFANDAVVTFCKTVLNLADVVCEGAIKNYLPEIWSIIEHNRQNLNGGVVCAIVLGGKCGQWNEISQWQVNLAGNKPEVIKPTSPVEGSPVTKVLHITDVHLQLDYTIGTNTDCGRPMCCTNDTDAAPSDELKAGYWGSYTCDVPIWTFEDMLKRIKEEHGHEIDYIMMTGDNPPHDVWSQSRTGNLEHSRAIARLIKEVFEDKEVVFALGNHESFPCNSFPPTGLAAPEFSSEWFYHAIGEMYSPWMTPTAVESFGKDGKYSFLLREGFRIIVINSNNCVTFNFWTMYQWVDMNGELQWLADELAAAEANNELVHIVSHVPPGNHDCLGGWGKEYSRIVDRFENIIRAQFYGHTHNDEYIVFYDSETNTRPVNIGHVTPSVSTYSGYNMAYRLYSIDGFYPGNSLRVLDHETFIFNLKTANFNGPDKRPEYFQLYEGRKDLQMKNLFPEDYDNLTRRLATDDIFFQKFARYFNKGGDYDTQPFEETICGLVTTTYYKLMSNI